MNDEKDAGGYKDEIYSKSVRAGKRTYFFDVKQTKGDDYYITLTESTKRFDGDGYERHKIFLYKEDFNRFLEGLEETINHIKQELMPDYDYDEYSRRNKEWEDKKRLESDDDMSVSSSGADGQDLDDSSESDEDISW